MEILTFLWLQNSSLGCGAEGQLLYGKYVENITQKYEQSTEVRLFPGFITGM